jgi:hypothetical protein
LVYVIPGDQFVPMVVGTDFPQITGFSRKLPIFFLQPVQRAECAFFAEYISAVELHVTLGYYFPSLV